jgi:hypothetical protein
MLPDVQNLIDCNKPTGKSSALKKKSLLYTSGVAAIEEKLRAKAVPGKRENCCKADEANRRKYETAI